MFFSFEGIDGSGKSTQMKLFCQWLTERGHEVVRCYDPGSTPLGEKIRSLLLDHHDFSICRTSEMLLFMAARAQLVEELIAPQLARGKIVVSDRFLLANVVYQGHAGGLDVEAIRSIGRVATAGIMPDLAFVLDLDVTEASQRLSRRRDRMESQGDEFLARVRQGYQIEAQSDPARNVMIDASRSIEAIQADIRSQAERILGK